MTDRTLEQQYADLLRGGEDNSPLTTSAYKFSMAQAGFPLRHEYFYLHFRRGGPLFIPFDFKAVMRELHPRLPNIREQAWLTSHGYGFTPAMLAALEGELHVYAQPEGTWANDAEPVITQSGPSFLVSWFEDLVIAFQFPMQVATAIHDGVREFTASCEAEAKIIHLVYEAMQNYLPESETRGPLRIEVKEELFRANLFERLGHLKRALGGETNRVFEVGGRSMTCTAHHRIVLEECMKAGINRTASAKMAYDLWMVPVGTTGHEHQERHGQDIDGFRAVRDQRPEPPSYLFDTYDPLKSGIPAAIETMLEDRKRRCSVRFDSGDQPQQLRQFRKAQREHGLDLFYLFMDGYDDKRVSMMEGTCRALKVPAEDRHYGIGGWLVIDPEIHQFSRNVVAMVYKLSQTGGPGYDGKTGARNVRKYSGTPGKESHTGRLVLFLDGQGNRYIAQQGEGLSTGHGVWLSRTCHLRPTGPSIVSPGTEAINEACRVRDLYWENF